MSYKTFNEWVANKDIFGFEKEKKQTQKIDHEEVYKPVNSEIILQELLKYPLNNKYPKWEAGDCIIWGNKDLGEAILLEVSPLGSFKVIARSYMKDLQGSDCWVCKSVEPLPNIEYEHKELRITEQVFHILEKIADTQDSASKDYVGLEKLTIKFAETMKRDNPCKQMVFEKVKKIDNNHYLITANITGNGAEGPLWSRVECFEMHMSFNPERGVIRCFGQNIQSPMRYRNFQSQPAEWDECFAPTQSNAEIISCLINALSTY